MPLALSGALAMPAQKTEARDFAKLPTIETPIPFKGGELSQEDIKKLESTAIETDSVLCQADILIMASDSVYAGLDQFNYYTEHTSK